MRKAIQGCMMTSGGRDPRRAVRLSRTRKHRALLQAWRGYYVRDAIGHVTERVVSRNTIPTLQSAMMRLSGSYRISPAFCSTSPAGFSRSFCIFFTGRAGLIVPLLLSASVGFSPLGFLSLVLAISPTSTALIFFTIEASPANTLAFSSSILSNCLLCLA